MKNTQKKKISRSYHLLTKTCLRGAECRKAGKPESRKAGKPESRKAGEPESRKAGKPESRKAGKPECRNAGNQDPEILKPGMTFREGKRAS